MLTEENPDANIGSNLAGLLDGDDPAGSGSDLSTIIYWDISAIPVGSLVAVTDIHYESSRLKANIGSKLKAESDRPAAG